MRQTVALQSSAYRNGLVLGLTMAEIMLLIVFSMLITSGLLLKNEHKKYEDLQEQTVHREELTEKVKIVEELIDSNPNFKIDDSWEHLKLAIEIKKELKQKGYEINSLSAVKETIRANLSQKTETNFKRNIENTIRNKGYYVDSKSDLIKIVQENLVEHSDPIITGSISNPKKITRSITDILENKGYKAGSQVDLLKLLEQLIPDKKEAGRHDWPPIITLSEADGFFFELGKAELTIDFKNQLSNKVIPKLSETAQNYDADVIEVIGHTDKSRISGIQSNLDEMLIPVLKGQKDVGILAASDNAGLGFSRAAVVSRFLMRNQRLKDFKIIPLSGAQVIDIDESLSLDGDFSEAKELRRIEIRVRRSSRTLQNGK